MSIRAIKGTRDILPPASSVWNRVEAAAREVFRTFNYHEIRTPIFEETALFARGVGEDTDIVNKEMYVFEDKGEEMLALRPEGTAGVVRAFIEHGCHVEGPQKWFYVGPMFRRERPQKGRYRQFHQIDIEVLGSAEPLADAEVIACGWNILQELGVATNIVSTAFAIIFGAVALAAALAFGLGNRDLAGEITREWYDRYRAEREAIAARYKQTAEQLAEANRMAEEILAGKITVDIPDRRAA